MSDYPHRQLSNHTNLVRYYVPLVMVTKLLTGEATSQDVVWERGQAVFLSYVEAGGSFICCFGAGLTAYNTPSGHYI